MNKLEFVERSTKEFCPIYTMIDGKLCSVKIFSFGDVCIKYKQVIANINVPEDTKEDIHNYICNNLSLVGDIDESAIINTNLGLHRITKTKNNHYITSPIITHCSFESEEDLFDTIKNYTSAKI